MGRTVTGRHKDTPHRYITLLAKVLGDGGCTFLAELLVELLRSGGGGVACDLDHVSRETLCGGDKGGEICFGSVVQGRIVGGEINACLGNHLVVIQVRYALVDEQDCSGVHLCRRACSLRIGIGCIRRTLCCVRGGLGCCGSLHSLICSRLSIGGCFLVRQNLLLF